MQGNKTAMLYLPASEVQIDCALERCGIQADEFYSLHIVGSSFGVDLEEYLNTKYETIQSLNSMCEATAGTRAEKLGAIIRSTSPESTEQIMVLAQDGFGLMTSDNLLDAAKSVVSAADTICNMNVPDVKNRGKHTDGEASHQPEELTEA